jgi:hypothetical protein
MRPGLWKKIALALSLLVLTGICGICGLLLGSVFTPDPHTAARGTTWTSLGEPPEAARKIAGEAVCGREYRVVAQSASGAYYISCQSNWEPWNAGSNGPVPMAACQGNPPTQYSPSFESLPYPVSDCGMKFTHEYVIAETVYTVLEDGSVWQWTFTYGMGTPIAYGVGGLIAGLAVGMIISIGIWRRNVHR